MQVHRPSSAPMWKRRSARAGQKLKWPKPYISYLSSLHLTAWPTALGYLLHTLTGSEPGDDAILQSAAAQTGHMDSTARDRCAAAHVGQLHQRSRRNHSAPTFSVFLASAGSASVGR